MSWIDFIYLTLLLLSIPFGHLVKLSGSALNKKLMCLGAGLFILLLLVGQSSWHSAVTIFGNYLILNRLGFRYIQIFLLQLIVILFSYTIFYVFNVFILIKTLLNFIS